MLIAQKITNLLNGVSQRSQEQRPSSQAQEQLNGLSSRVRGLMKRPPLSFLGKLTASVTGWSDAFVHPINRDEQERYHVVVANGNVEVYDAITATPVTVLAPDGTTYLDDPSGAGFRAATAGDTTVIVNRGVTVKQGNTKAPRASFEALLYVRQADYGTTYTVTVDGTPIGITTLDATSAQSREAISTDSIAADLYTALTGDLVLSQTYVFERFGSTIHLFRIDFKDFTLTVADGLADQGLKAVKGSVQDFTDLPRKAPNGFTIEVAGDPDSTSDNYWVKFDDQGNPEQDGVWRECAAPGTPTSLDKATMPHRLVRYGDILQRVVHEAIKYTLSGNVIKIQPAEGTLLTQSGFPHLGPWTTTVPSNTAIPAGTAATVQDQGSGVSFTLGADYAELGFGYLLDLRVVEPGNFVTVSASVNGTVLATRRHAPGSRFEYLPPVAGVSGFFSGIKIEGAFHTGDVVDLTISYDRGITPDQYRSAFFTPDIVYAQTASTVSARLLGTETYPPGVTITVTINGTPFSYTTTGVGVTISSVVIAGLAAAITGTAGITVSTSTDPLYNRLNISTTTLTFPDVTIAASANEAHLFNNPGLSMVTNEHVGRTLKNLSDGSTGTITANTDTTITVAALAGGVDNVFNPGDLVSVIGTGRYFIFEPCPWDLRAAGDLTLAPLPSFVDNEIADAFFYQNRLGFISNENVVLSESGNLFNFFRTTVTQLPDSDPIDVKSAHREVSLFKSAQLFNGSLYLTSDNAEWLVSGEPTLTPSSIRIDLVGQFPNSPTVRPVVCGTRMYAARGKGGFTQVQEFYIPPSMSITSENTQFAAVDVTADAPKYIKGNPLAFAGDASLGILALLTDENGQTLYIYSFALDPSNGQRSQSSWSRWQFASGQIIGIDIVDGKLGVLALRSDGAYLGTIDLNVALDASQTDEPSRYADWSINNPGGTAYDAGTDTTTWTLPYSVAVDGSEGDISVALRTAPFTRFTVTRPSPTTVATSGDHHLDDVAVGVLYTFTYNLSRLYFRPQNDEPDTRGWLVVRWLDILFHDSTDFDVTVALTGRPSFTKSFASGGDPTSGKLHAPVLGRNEYADITISSTSPGVCAISSLDWEGDYATRSRRI